MEESLIYSEKGYRFWFRVRPVFKKLLRVEVSGTENIPEKGGCIIASNHRSNLDPFVLNVISPRPILFMAKEELFKIPVLSWLIKKAGAFPVKRNGRDIKAMKKALTLLKEGYCIGIFPEGGRAKPKEFKNPQSGVGLLVSKTEAPVIPVRIEGTDDVYPVGSKFPKVGKSIITVRIGSPIEIDRTADYREISKEIMERIKKL
ncbi:1-acyl-sn-glycerol-3-phosphate acyltransferase [Persephonella atlantica]|uniref:1-acyl-sn-glycerol-3-phosphate acyltransferase n=1 Tax=Persephonella atlantica TaxID=2699429 RepID=A0ABS1GJU1_9AQUI|nr:lysophospholipid acyltransferase family protein [Persephonella atlantica]MBK3333146.1 1-acyl-sn-glycerol-3-phosphate acyltransferase [Persephonella atlantica]